MIRRIGQLAAVVVVLLGLNAAPLAAADLWTVPSVPVDGTGESPSTAKEAALSQGRLKAWTELFRRLTPASEWARQPQLLPQELEQMVKSFDVANERHSSTRYLATVTFVFDPVTVRTALRRYNLQFSDSTAKPVLVIPLSSSAWLPESAWAKAWFVTAQRGYLVPIVVPVGDVAEMPTLTGAAAAADWSAVQPIADRYGAGLVIVVSATRSAAGLKVDLTQIKPQGRTQRTGSYQPQGTEDEMALSLRAAGAIADGVQEEWKRSTSVDYGAQATLVASVSFGSLADWIGMRHDLESVRLIQNVLVQELTLQGARLRFDYVGKIDQLQTALAQSNLYLTDNGNGTWILSRSAAPSPSAASLP